MMLFEVNYTRAHTHNQTHVYVRTYRTCGNTDACGILHRLAARTWYSLEVNNRRAYINSKDLVFGDQAFDKLGLVMNSWVCKQMGENVRQRSTLTPQQVCDCVFVFVRVRA